MDNKELALELLKLLLSIHRERMGVDELVATYLYILKALNGGQQPAQTQQSSDDDLFDFKSPLSASDRDG